MFESMFHGKVRYIEPGILFNWKIFSDGNHVVIKTGYDSTGTTVINRKSSKQITTGGKHDE